MTSTYGSGLICGFRLTTLADCSDDFPTRPVAHEPHWLHFNLAVPNVTRIVVQGSTTRPLSEWLRVHVDPASPAVFSWERNVR